MRQLPRHAGLPSKLPRARRGLTCVLVLAAAAACRPDDQRTDTMDPREAMQARESLPMEVVTELDSGSAAFRAGDHPAALAHYTRATEHAPNAAGAWFGVYMAQHAMGNEDAAREALLRAQSMLPNSTLAHPTAADTLR